MFIQDPSSTYSLHNVCPGVSLPILTILVALVRLIQADCPIDKPNLWCGTTSGGVRRRIVDNDNVDCQAYAHQCSSY
ncbi:hypothetical protein PSHT_15724 [Puccinia striiformis]|uniref:Uncharacterized protein n=1 Tax=Puccinia striiformis TaxID=27350 RepID=A0A2S4UDJ0_9BASI|nr:hypothetical protein PSHT_15724 [Puccinia striiformis]